MISNKPRGISLNKNAANILNVVGLNNQQAANNGPLKGRESPNEPSPPKLRSYSRNSLRQHLPNQQELLPNEDKLIDLEVLQPMKQQLINQHQQQLNYQSLKPELKLLMTSDENKDEILRQPVLQHHQKQQQQHQQLQLQNNHNKQQPAALEKPPQQQLNIKQLLQQQQESIISRIPRLSQKFSLAPLLNNHQQRDVAAVVAPQPKPSMAKLLEEAEPAEVAVVEVCEEEIEDIDKSMSRDAIFQVCDVAKDIYDYMYTLEDEQSIKEDYLRDQKILTPRVRQRLINWCIEINSQLKLLPETLYMTIAVIDRFFERVPVKQQNQVQLAAVGATLIASKYEEIYPPDVDDLIHLTQKAYTRREIMRIEIYILEQLEFNLGRPIPLAFLRRFSKAAHCDLKMHSIAKYLMELSLTEYECAHWPPSMLAAAALFTTIHLVHSDSSSSALQLSSALLSRSAKSNSKLDRWNQALIHYTRYTRKQLQEPAGTLCKILKRAQKNPQSYACVKKNMPNLAKWPELKSTRVDELIKLGDQM